MDKVAVVIPVRGGSKGIHLKNIKEFCGRPLVYWTVAAACSCAQVDHVYVSTDSELIAKTVKSFGFSKLDVIHRPKETATDEATTESAMLDFAMRYQFEHIMLIQATSPLLDEYDIKEGIKKYLTGKYDSLLSVVRQKRFIWKVAREDALPFNYHPEARPRRQEMEGFLVENGAFYITSRDNLLKSRCRLSGRIGLYEMPEDTYFEIDEISDWIIMENLKNIRLRDKGNIVKNNITLFVTDVDGVLTDGGMYYDNQNNEQKKFNTRDGKGIELLKASGIKVMFLTSEENNIVRRRAEKLQVDFCFMGIKNKKQFLDEFFKTNSQYTYANMAYIGDDINDLDVLRIAGFSAAPNDATKENKAVVHYVCKHIGGKGCVREFCELILDGLGDC